MIKLKIQFSLQFPLNFILLFILVEKRYLNNRNTNMQVNIYFSWRVQCMVIIFVNPFISSVTDRYLYKQCIIMETETEKT